MTKIELIEQPRLTFLRETKEVELEINGKSVRVSRSIGVDDDGRTDLEAEIEIDEEDRTKLTDEEADEVIDFVYENKIKW